MTTVGKAIYSVQVRELIEFALRTGDLGGERAFVGRGRALAGTRGHQKIQQSRPTEYQKEVRVSYELEVEELVLRVQGRIDGLMITTSGVLLEEIKTIQGSWDHQPDPLHWAQAKCYAFIYAHDHKLESIVIRLTYLELETGRVSEFDETCSIKVLATFFQEAVAIYLDWIREHHRRCQERNESIRLIEFPFSRYRTGQRELAVAAYRTLAGGGRLFLEAPTGIGKTMSVLFPAWKALGEGRLERIFYLTARTVGRTVAENALAELRTAGLRARTLTLTAKEKLCVREGLPCDVTACPLARGYYDRIKSAMRAALACESLTRSVLEKVGEEHQVCPFELSLDLSSWVDVIVCDYNYVFDPKVYLRRHFEEQRREYGFLVDEAHNLADRAREMFSAELRTAQVLDVQHAIQKQLPDCARKLSKLAAGLRELWAASEGPLERHGMQEGAPELDLFAANPGQVSALRPSEHRNGGVMMLRELPSQLLLSIEEALEAAENWLARNQPAEFRDALLDLFFSLHSFRRTADLYDDRYVTIVDSAAQQVRLFCVDPSFLLRQALERGTSAIFFSATLTPVDYYQIILGGDSNDPLLQLPSPFAPEHVAVLVHDRIRTDLKARSQTLEEVVQSVAALVQGRRGNYLVYFPSFAYLTSVREQFQKFVPQIEVLAQQRGMTESERESFLAMFAKERKETLVGFAVMGGVFGEGIDLVGESLIGAAIVGVGLPQLSVERDLIRDYFQEKTASGFEYAYTFPGMNRVLQASGRVIRSETDKGVVLLIDSRFGVQRYRRLFPGWWQPARVRSATDIAQAVQSFWEAD